MTDAEFNAEEEQLIAIADKLRVLLQDAILETTKLGPGLAGEEARCILLAMSQDVQRSIKELLGPAPVACGHREFFTDFEAAALETSRRHELLEPIYCRDCGGFHLVKGND